MNSTFVREMSLWIYESVGNELCMYSSLITYYTLLIMLQLEIGDRLILRKKHACGGAEWKVWRLGMDIGIQCLKCGRKLKMIRAELEKNVKEVIGGA